MERVTTIDVDGMTCANCVSHLTEELNTLDGVLNVSVELRQGESSPVQIFSNAALDADAIHAAVDEAGYTVTAIHP